MIMKLDLSKVEFSRNDKRLGIKVPTELTEDLAYFIGVHVGDGYMSVQKRPSAIDYRIEYSGHSVNESMWYRNKLKPLVSSLFNKNASIRFTKRKCVMMGFRSKAILTFLHKTCGIQLSPKNNIDVPTIIKNSNNKIKAAFIKGLIDTDGSLIFKKAGKLPTIDFATSSVVLFESFQVLIGGLGIKYCTNVYKTKRKGTPVMQYKVQINGKKRLAQWVKLIGFSSYNHLTKYAVWRLNGFIKPYSNILDRIKILKKEASRARIEFASEIDLPYHCWRPDGFDCDSKIAITAVRSNP